MATCKDCYWYSDVGVIVCDHEKEPTMPDEEACEFFEDDDDADGRP